MDNILKNKKTIIICILLILFVFIIYLFNQKNGLLGEIDTENYEYLKNYKSNEFLPVYVTEEDMVKKYLNDYKNNMLFNVDDAFNSLNKEYREKRFVDINGYKKYLDSILSLSVYSTEVEKYSVTNIGGNKLFNIYDKSGNQYLIKEISIMDYEVYLDEYTVTIN